MFVVCDESVTVMCRTFCHFGLKSSNITTNVLTMSAELCRSDWNNSAQPNQYYMLLWLYYFNLVCPAL